VASAAGPFFVVLLCHLLSNALSLSKGASQSWQASFWSLSLWNDDVDKQKNRFAWILHFGNLRSG
jgi:hypothetical protein